MTESRNLVTVSDEKCRKLLKTFPCFASLTDEQSKELASMMVEVCCQSKQVIVKENDLIDSVYIIVEGTAEVTRSSEHRKKIVQVPVASLSAGEGIGLHDTGFYSKTGRRTATVTSVNNMILLQLDVKDLYQFLKRNQLESSMYNASLQMLRMRFIKQSLPFAKISDERLQWLADKVEEMSVPSGTIIFKQGEKGDKCYLIRKGQVEIVHESEGGVPHQLAILQPPVLFGEATLITHEPRNATARAVEDTELLMLKHEYLSELIESEQNVASMFMTLMVDRSRPIRNSAVTVHQRSSADGQQITILKNPETNSYFKLSKEGHFIWKQLDGNHTLQDITLGLAERFDVFAPDVVAALISKLTRSGFVENVELNDNVALEKQPLWVRMMVKIQRMMDKRIAFGDADPWVTKVYNRFVRHLLTRKAQVVLVSIMLLGLISFITNTSHVLEFFGKKHISLLLLLGLVPLSLAELLLHELGHAFAVKACGREVHYIGVGWSFSGPVAFTDTSDMWLATRKPRILVNLAGVYVDILIAGAAALSIWFIPNPYVQGMLWLFSLYTYIGGFRMLSPLQEMDGYYALMDWVEKNKLRQSAVLWLVKNFPKSLRSPKLFKEHKAEVTYWLACIVFLILVSILTLVVQKFVLAILGMQSSNPYISLLLPFLVVIFSSLGIIADIRNQKEE